MSLAPKPHCICGSSTLDYEAARAALARAPLVHASLGDFDLAVALARDFIVSALPSRKLVLFSDSPLLRDRIHTGLAIARFGERLEGENDALDDEGGVRWPRVDTQWEARDSSWHTAAGAVLVVHLGALEVSA